MSNCFVFNMGYDTSHVTSVLASEGLEDGTRVVLAVVQGLDERQENSVSDVRNYLDSIDIETELSLVEVSGSMGERIAKFLDILEGERQKVVSLSGGPRDNLVPLTLAVSASSKGPEKVYMRSDVDSKLQRIDIPDTPVDLSDSESGILQSLDGFTSVESIISELDYSGSTVYRRLSDLESRELVESRKLDGESCYRLTATGRLALEVRD
jgi:CRISPR locus-related DNA-binding protein